MDITEIKLPIILLMIVVVSIWCIMNRDTEHYRDTKKYDVLVISAGGGGTTYFMDYLSKNTNLKMNDINDKDTLKHISFDREDKLNNVDCDKIIYLYNDPLLAIKSHFRRDWAFNQLRKHGNPHNLREDEVKDINSFLEKTEMHNRDLYGIKEQYDFYMNGNINKNIMFINFNNISKSKDKIAGFIGVDEKIFDDFEVRSRNSNNKDIDSHVINKIYKELYDKINRMDATIRTYT